MFSSITTESVAKVVTYGKDFFILLILVGIYFIKVLAIVCSNILQGEKRKV